VAADTHIWNVPSLNFVGIISRNESKFTLPGQPDSVLAVLADDGEFITSTLTLTATVASNQTNITCADGREKPGEGEMVAITTEIFGVLAQDSC
jgi:hypothetical protein